MTSLNRVIQRRISRNWLRELPLNGMHVAEISGKWGQYFKFASYTQFQFPEYDICKGPFTDANGAVRKFDLIIADQVWEHLDRPYAATRHVRKMLKKGGFLYLSTPFFIPFHAAPSDNSRWSARGLRNLLIESGFEQDAIRAQHWGNKAAILRNLEKEWPPEHIPERDDLTNDPKCPVMAWALAQKT